MNQQQCHLVETSDATTTTWQSRTRVVSTNVALGEKTHFFTLKKYEWNLLEEEWTLFLRELVGVIGYLRCSEKRGTIVQRGFIQRTRGRK